MSVVQCVVNTEGDATQGPLHHCSHIHNSPHYNEEHDHYKVNINIKPDNNNTDKYSCAKSLTQILDICIKEKIWKRKYTTIRKYNKDSIQPIELHLWKLLTILLLSITVQENPPKWNCWKILGLKPSTICSVWKQEIPKLSAGKHFWKALWLLVYIV